VRTRAPTARTRARPAFSLLEAVVQGRNQFDRNRQVRIVLGRFEMQFVGTEFDHRADGNPICLAILANNPRDRQVVGNKIKTAIPLQNTGLLKHDAGVGELHVAIRPAAKTHEIRDYRGLPHRRQATPISGYKFYLQFQSIKAA